MIAVGVSTREQFNTVKKLPKVQRIDLELECFSLDAIRSMLQEVQSKDIYIIFPRMFRKNMEEELLESLALKPVGCIVRTLDELAFARKHFTEGRIICDYSVYTYNEQAALQYQELIKDIGLTLPVELNREELKELIQRYPTGNWEWIVYGAQPVMISAQCVMKNTKGCRKEAGVTIIQNQHRDKYRVQNVCKYCYNVIFEDVVTSLLDVYSELLDMPISTIRIQLTKETADETGKILNAFLTGMDHNEKSHSENKEVGNEKIVLRQSTTKLGHYKKGIE